MKAVLLPAVFALSVASLCKEDLEVQVEPLVFSGTPNPIVTLSPEQQLLFCEAAASAIPRARTCRVLGFTGWRVCVGIECEIFRGDAHVDEVLLDAVQSELSKEALLHIKEESVRLLSSNDACEDDLEVAVSSLCERVVGPDDPRKVHYDVGNDDNGCFGSNKMQWQNNCYNYGNDIVTNTFAQPGRRDFDGGDGICSHSARPCVPNECEDVKNAAIADGLTWVGTALPTELPEEGHYVSLHIWPKTNFHWLRMDADMKWSHKPGRSPVRNVDNTRQLITDPQQASLSPWSQHCGYMSTVPSKIAGSTEQVQI